MQYLGNPTPKPPFISTLICIFSTLLFACAEPSKNGDGELVTRVLNDSPVNGVSYSCGDQTGITKNGGEFDCKKAPVTFSIGHLTLGTIASFNNDKQVFPQDFTGASRSNFNDDKSIKLAQLLQSLDDDGDISQSINIPETMAEKFQTIANVDNLTLEQLAAISGTDIVTRAYAISHLRRTLTGGDDRSDYTISINIADANSASTLITTVDLVVKGAEVYSSERSALNRLSLDGFRKTKTLFLKNLPEENQDIKIVTKADGYLDSGLSVTLSPEIKHYSLNLNLVKDEEGVLANGVFASEQFVAHKVSEFGFVTETITLENKESDNKPGAKLTIPAGTLLTDKNGDPVVGAKLKITSFDPYQEDAMAAYPGGLNVMADTSGFSVGGETQEGDAEVNFKSAGFAAVRIVDEDGNKVKDFSNEVEIAMQFAIGTKDADGEVVIVGDEIPIWSFDEDTSKWTYEKMGTVQDIDLSDGLFDVVFGVNHLSYWNFDWRYGQGCEASSKFYLKNLDDEPLDANDFTFHLIMNESPSISVWSQALLQTSSTDYIQMARIRGSTPGTLEVWTKDIAKKLASQYFIDACSGSNFELKFDYDDALYEYDAAIEMLGILNAAVDKSIGIRPVEDDLNFIQTIAEMLETEEPENSLELSTMVAEVALLYSGAFIEADGYVGVTIDIYGCDKNQQNFIDELEENYAYQRMFSGPYADTMSADMLPYIITAATAFIDHNPDQLAYAPYGIRGYTYCGAGIAEQLFNLGDSSGLESTIFGRFEPVTLANVATVKLDIETELTDNGIVSESSAATLVYAVSHAETLATEWGFSNAAVAEIAAARAYLNELIANGNIGGGGGTD